MHVLYVTYLSLDHFVHDLIVPNLIALLVLLCFDINAPLDLTIGVSVTIEMMYFSLSGGGVGQRPMPDAMAISVVNA